MTGAGTDGDGDAEAQLRLCAALAIALAFLLLLPHAPAVPPRHADCHHLLPLSSSLEAVLSLKEEEGEEEEHAKELPLLLAALLQPEELLPLSRRKVEVGPAMTQGGAVGALLRAVAAVTEKRRSELSQNFGAWWKLAAVSLFLLREVWERCWQLPGVRIVAGFLAKTWQKLKQDQASRIFGALFSVSCVQVSSCERQELVTAEGMWPPGCLSTEVSLSEPGIGAKRLQASSLKKRKEGENFEPRLLREMFVNCIAAATVRLTKTARGMDFDLHDFSGTARQHFVPLLVRAAGHQ